MLVLNCSLLLRYIFLESLGVYSLFLPPGTVARCWPPCPLQGGLPTNGRAGVSGDGGHLALEGITIFRGAMKKLVIIPHQNTQLNARRIIFMHNICNAEPSFMVAQTKAMKLSHHKIRQQDGKGFVITATDRLSLLQFSVHKMNMHSVISTS